MTISAKHRFGEFFDCYTVSSSSTVLLWNRDIEWYPTACVTKKRKLYDRQDRHALPIPYIAPKSSIWNVLVCAKRGLGCWEPFSLGIPLLGVSDLCYGNMIWNVWLEKQSRSSFEAFDMSIKRENTNSEQDNRWYWGRYCPWTMLYCSNEKLVKTCVSQKWTKVVARFFSC